MYDNTIITIGRQFGSGGREIGKALALKLGISYYDRKLVELAAKKSGMSEEVFKQIEETSSSSLLFSIATGAYALGNITALSEPPIQDKLFIIESNIIKELAAVGPAVIVGRASDYILRDNEHCINLFIKASLESRTSRISKLYGLDEEQARKLIIKTDKRRANFYNYYTDSKWGNLDNYDLVIDSKFGVDACVDTIMTYINGQNQED